MLPAKKLPICNMKFLSEQASSDYGISHGILLSYIEVKQHNELFEIATLLEHPLVNIIAFFFQISDVMFLSYMVCLLNSPYFHSKRFDPDFFSNSNQYKKVQEFSCFT